MKTFSLAALLIVSLQNCTTMDFSAIEDSWSFDEFRKYSLLRCTAVAFQNEKQFDIAHQYYVKAESLLALSAHPANVYYHLNEQSKQVATNLSVEQSGKFCMDWVLSREFELNVVHHLSSSVQSNR